MKNVASLILTALLLASAAIAATNPENLVKQLIATIKTLQADATLSQMLKTLPSGNPDLPSLRPFAETWSSASPDIVSRTTTLAQQNGMSFDEFLRVGDQVVCALNEIDRPNVLDELSSQLDDIESSLNSNPQPGQNEQDAKADISKVRQQIQFCRAVTEDLKSAVKLHQKELVASLGGP